MPTRTIHYDNYDEIARAHRDAMIARADQQIEKLFMRIAELRNFQLTLRSATDPMLGLPDRNDELTAEQEQEIQRIARNLSPFVEREEQPEEQPTAEEPRAPEAATESPATGQPVEEEDNPIPQFLRQAPPAGG